jgi:hypothetical protein
MLFGSRGEWGCWIEEYQFDDYGVRVPYASVVIHLLLTGKLD